MIFILVVIIVLLLSDKKEKSKPVVRRTSSEFDSIGRKIYNARFGPGYKFNVPKHILNNPNYVVHYLE